jgi:hypothetical protein
MTAAQRMRRMRERRKAAAITRSPASSLPQNGRESIERSELECMIRAAGAIALDGEIVIL